MVGLDFSEPGTRRVWLRRLLGPLDGTAWESMARKLFAWQFARVGPYRRLCEAHGVHPRGLSCWRDIPAVPQQLFKRTRLYAHGSRPPGAVYETSGTTTGQAGRQYLFRDDLYRSISVAGARQSLFLEDRPELHFLVPSPAEAPRSSLSAMFGFWQKAARQTGFRFWIRQERFDLDGLVHALRSAVQKRKPLALCGTAFSFVHLLDAGLEKKSLQLPSGSRLLETGGFKGRSREVPKAELYSSLKRLFGLPDAALWNEYGMSELSSQAYAQGLHGLHLTPPWVRVLVCDPATGREVALGKRGLIRWYDLANTDSVFALQTLDLAERAPDGFRLLGRLARTEPRGCSLGVEDLISRAAPEITA